MTALDESFALVYLASVYLAPGARFVCARADRLLPFRPGSFSSVICSDALHDAEEPERLAREILRVLTKGATALAIHLHNPAFEHPYPGRNPLSAEGYASIFSGGDPRMLDEGPILERWLARREVDLSAGRPPSTLHAARTFTLLAGDRRVDRLHAACAPEPSHVALSPLYRAVPGNGGLRLRREWPSAMYLREYPDAGRYLPEEAELDARALESLRHGRLEGVAVDLFRRRVLLDLPPTYGAETPW